MSSIGLSHYQAVSTVGQLDGATPHRVAQLMLETLATRIAEAKGHLQRGEVEARGRAISKAIAIVEGLVMSLDRERGGDIASNLEALYDYIFRGLLSANADGNADKLTELSCLIQEIRSGWDAIESVPAAQ
jgi:flagellar protein FliS